VPGYAARLSVDADTPPRSGALTSKALRENDATEISPPPSLETMRSGSMTY
jgi:hypothetical protein